MATFFNSQVWCSMKPLSITRARNTVQLPYQLPVLEPLYSRQTCQSPHALAMLSPLSSPSRNTAASPSGRTSLHNWHERRVSTDCGQRNRSGASHLCAAHARCWHDARCTCPAGGGGMCGHKARNVPTYVRVFAAPWPPGSAHQCSHAHSAPGSWGYSTAVTGQPGFLVPGKYPGVPVPGPCRCARSATRKASSPSMRTSTERNSVLTCLTSAR